MAFRLAERSHHVTGIDYLPINVAVSEALAVEHPDLDVTFIEGDLVDAASLVELDTFDLVIGFAVLHHIAYRDGHVRAVELVSQLMERIPYAVFEMALSNETMTGRRRSPRPRRTLWAISVHSGVGPHLNPSRRCPTPNPLLQPVARSGEWRLGAYSVLVRGAAHGRARVTSGGPPLFHPG